MKRIGGQTILKKRNLGTELCLAVIKPDCELVKSLLAEGADINSFGDKDFTRVAHRTPLWLAVSSAGQEIADSWVDFHAALCEVFPNILTRNHSEKRQAFLAIVKHLLQLKPQLELHCFGSTPLRIAVANDDVEIVAILLANGANAGAETYSPISTLAKQQKIKGPLGMTGYYDTILHEAVRKNNSLIVKALLVAGAEPRRADHEGKTPLDIAREKGHAEIVLLLQGPKPIS